MTGSHRLLERFRLLARVGGIVERAADRSGGMLVIRGRPGVGKTSLLRAAVDAADGLTVASLRGDPAETAVPFGGLERLFASIRVPGRRSGGGPTVPLPRERAVWLSYVAVARGFGEALAHLVDMTGPLLVAVDDAQWVDGPTLALLASLARNVAELPVAVLLAVSGGEAVPELSGLDAVDLPALDARPGPLPSRPDAPGPLVGAVATVDLTGPDLTFEIGQGRRRAGMATDQDRPAVRSEALASHASRRRAGHRSLEGRRWSDPPAPLADELLRPGRAQRRPAYRPHEYVVQLLGDFRVGHGSDDLTPRPPQPAQLVKIVALRGRLSVDELIETLWPDGDPGVGRVRIRNVLFRAREACPGLLERDAETVSLHPLASVDARDFDREAARALNGPRDGGQGPADSARLALSLYTGELLPADRYAAWCSTDRERLAGRHRELLEVVMDHSERTGDDLAAVRLAEEAIVLQPYDESLYARAAQLMARLGWRYKALQMLRRAEAVAADLGVPPSRPVLQLYAQLRGD
ncbi:MAG TPA: AAA family ATPase [Acidimicrobiales bacterium]|nr:AAA family ATPase [Acidimicrobiales bacterium]